MKRPTSSYRRHNKKPRKYSEPYRMWKAKAQRGLDAQEEAAVHTKHVIRTFGPLPGLER